MSVVDQRRSFDKVAVPEAGVKTFSVIACPDAGQTAVPVLARTAQALQAADATVVSQRIFGSGGDGLESPPLWSPGSGPAWPVTRLCGNGRAPATRPSSQISAISGGEVRPLRLDGHILGSLFEDDYAEYCVLGDLRPKDVAASHSLQARSVFEGIEEAIRLAGMDLSHIVRTWFFLDTILDWYSDFNSVRTGFFSERGMFERFLPASTGVGTSNAGGAALVADVLAMKPKDGRLNIREVRSPLQCPATQYRSSFSRAVEIRTAGYRRLYISGTASICPDGETAHRGDMARQVALAMRVAEGILNRCEMDWSNVVRGSAYFKNLDDKPVFDNYLQERELPGLPIITAAADICRDDLLFEIEIDAATGSSATVVLRP